MLPIDALIRKADTTTTQLAALIPELWASELEPNLRKREVFQQSVVVNTDLVGAAGDRVFLPILPDIAAADDLTEDADMTPIALSAASSVELIPAEKGKAVGITRKVLDRMKYDGMSQLVDRLAYSMSLKIEGSIAALWSASVPGTSNKMTVLYPNGHAAATLVSGDVFNDAMLLNALATLKSADNVPFDDDLFRLYLHPKQVRDLLADPDVRNDFRYAAPEKLLRGEIGVYQNCRIIESTHVVMVEEGASSTVPAYKAILMAPRWAAIAYKRTPAMVVDPTVYDFGRRRKVGIVADFDIQLVHNERAIVISTAASI